MAVAGFVLIRIADGEIAHDVQDRSDVSVTSDDNDEIFVLVKAQAVGSSASLKREKTFDLSQGKDSKSLGAKLLPARARSSSM